MPDIAAMEPEASAHTDLPEPEPLEFTVLSQKLELEVDFPTRSLKGTAIFEIQPWTKDLKHIKMNARQCKVHVEKVTVDRRSCKVEWEDQYRRIAVPKFVEWTADNWGSQKEKIEDLVKGTEEPELTIHLPKGFVIRAANAEQLGALSNRADIGSALAANSTSATNSDTEYLPIHVTVPFSTTDFRDGIHFAGLDEGDLQYPHMYTKQSSAGPGISRCIFPCFDNPQVKPQWTISIKCARTLGDALAQEPVGSAVNGKAAPGANGLPNGTAGNSVEAETIDYCLDDDTKLLEMMVVCSGDIIHDVIDPADTKKKIVTYEIAGNMVYAGYIGFSVGPFEYVDLSSHRNDEENVKLGQNAVKINGYCLPGRSTEVNNAAQPLCFAVDHFCITYAAYPFTEYTVCFVGDQIQDTVDTASMTLCSERLLHPEEVIDELIPVARKLVHALARQYMGISILPDTPNDSWLVIGIARFLTDNYMKELCGNNEFQFDLKQRADRVMELDMRRPSIYDLGSVLNLGAFELEFMELKAPLVLHMLDRRISKDPNHALTGLNRIISKIFTSVNTGGSTDDARTVTTESFIRQCERFCKNAKLSDFFKQWVYHAGYPRFSITQKFDKKNLKIKLTVKQTQNLGVNVDTHALKRSDFERESKEDFNEVYASDPTVYFTGSMSVRVHEADGTPYEHTFTIDSKEKTIDIPYNTKYKRLRRSHKQREREAASKGDANVDGVDDILLYCLGDKLQSAQEMDDWGLRNWDQETLTEMEAESFEWISIDADHEWRVSAIDHIMKPYMWASQLQQDRDVVAHVNAIKALAKLPPSEVISSILVRTIMDPRYFHGVRTMAAESIPAHAKGPAAVAAKYHLEKAFHTLFCYEGTSDWTPRPNDFSDWQSYKVQTALAASMSKVRDDAGNCNSTSQRFILQQLKLNDNSENQFSDAFYVGKLLETLADSMIPVKRADGIVPLVEELSEEEKESLQEFRNEAFEEFERYQKIDETMGSWKNIYTRECLKAKLRLMQAGIIPSCHQTFLAYVHPETFDLVQIQAMSAVVDLGALFKFDGLIRFFLHVMSTNGSPFLRDQLFKIFWEGLASVAFGEHVEKQTVGTDDDGVLVFHGQEQSDTRATQIARTTKVTDALAALRTELNGNAVLKEALWEAVKSPYVTLGEQASLLEFCGVLYDPIQSFLMTLRYPRYYSIRNLGQGKLLISRKDTVRTKFREGYLDAMKAKQPSTVATTKKTIKIIRSSGSVGTSGSTSNSGEMRAPARPSVPKVAATAKTTPTVTLKREPSVSSTSTITSNSQVRTQTPSVPGVRPSRVVKLRFTKKKTELQTFANPRYEDAPKKPTVRLTFTKPNKAKGSALDLDGTFDPASATKPMTPMMGGSKPVSAPARIPLPGGSGERKPLPSGRNPLPDSKPTKRPRESDATDEVSPKRKLITLKYRRKE